MANVDLELNIPMVTLDGTPFSSGETQGKLVANQLATSPDGDPIKYYDWAVTLWAGKSISVDQSDLQKLIKFIKDTTGLVVLSRAQILKTLEKYKE